MLQIKTLAVGSGKANCYIIYNEKNALIIDPGAEAKRIRANIAQLEAIPVAILLTHTHFDHIGAVDSVREEFQIPVYVAPEEQDWLEDPTKNLSSLTGQEVSAQEAEYLFTPEEVLKIKDFTFKVTSTPGHSPGSVSFIFEDDHFVVSGDALFKGSVGRVDLPGSEPGKLLAGIREKLFSLPEDYQVYPGHGPSSTIGTEMHTNPFFNE